MKHNGILYIGIVVIVVFLLFSSGCVKKTNKSTVNKDIDENNENSLSGKVNVVLSWAEDNIEPSDRVRLNVKVVNGFLNTITDVWGRILTDPVNMVVDHSWKNIASSLKSGDEKEVSLRLKVKPKDEFVSSATEEELKVRVKYRTDLRTYAKFKIADSSEGGKKEKVETVSEIVPIKIEIDPKEVPLDTEEDVSIEIKIMKESTEESGGILEDEISLIRVEIPGASEFDLAGSECEYETDSSRNCALTGDILELSHVRFYNNEIVIRLRLPLSEENFDKLRGTERSVIVSLEDIWLYKDKTITAVYSVE